jgi:hypothetical protein
LAKRENTPTYRSRGDRLAGTETKSALNLEVLSRTVGKFSISDVFNQNKYAQNPRKDFMNWALIDSGSYDYAADAWGCCRRMVSGPVDDTGWRVRHLYRTKRHRARYDL